MDWNISSELFLKDFNGELVNAIKITTDKNKSIELILKKNESNQLCIIGNNDYVDLITKLLNKISPGMEFMVQFILPMFKPLQIKIDMENLRVDEAFIGNKSINVPNISNIDDINNLNFSQVSNFFNKPKLINSNPNSLESDDEEAESEEVEQGEEVEEVDLDDLEDEKDEGNEEEEETNNEMDNLNNLLGGMNMNSDILSGLLGGGSDNKSVNPMNIMGKMKDIWTNDFYDNADEQEDLDDFLVEDNIEKENKNFSKYSNFEKNNIMFELCISNIEDSDSIINSIDEFFTKEYYDILIGNNGMFDLHGLTKDIILGSDGEEYLSLQFTNTKIPNINFKYSNMLQIKEVLLKLANFYNDKKID